VWCQDNNLSLNISKTKELIMDYRKRGDEHTPIYIDGAVVQRVENLFPNSYKSISEVGH
jgi:Cft2 family RNA processing exonuclease